MQVPGQFFCTLEAVCALQAAGVMMKAQRAQPCSERQYTRCAMSTCTVNESQPKWLVRHVSYSIRQGLRCPGTSRLHLIGPTSSRRLLRCCRTAARPLSLQTPHNIAGGVWLCCNVCLKTSLLIRVPDPPSSLPLDSCGPTWHGRNSARPLRLCRRPLAAGHDTQRRGGAQTVLAPSLEPRCMPAFHAAG